MFLRFIYVSNWVVCVHLFPVEYFSALEVLLQDMTHVWGFETGLEQESRQRVGWADPSLPLLLVVVMVATISICICFCLYLYFLYLYLWVVVVCIWWATKGSNPPAGWCKWGIISLEIFLWKIEKETVFLNKWKSVIFLTKGWVGGGGLVPTQAAAWARYSNPLFPPTVWALARARHHPFCKGFIGSKIQKVLKTIISYWAFELDKRFFVGCGVLLNSCAVMSIDYL